MLSISQSCEGIRAIESLCLISTTEKHPVWH